MGVEKASTIVQKSTNEKNIRIYTLTLISTFLVIDMKKCKIGFKLILCPKFDKGFKNVQFYTAKFNFKIHM